MAYPRAFAFGACALTMATACARPSSPPLEVSATAYCLEGTTRSGEPTREGIIAADPRLLPLGSVVRIDGLEAPLNGTYTVTDTGSAIKGQRIDIFMSDCRAARQFGRQDAQLWVLESGGSEDDDSIE